jgi:hypothetical protein
VFDQWEKPSLRITKGEKIKKSLQWLIKSFSGAPMDPQNASLWHTFGGIKLGVS